MQAIGMLPTGAFAITCLDFGAIPCKSLISFSFGRQKGQAENRIEQAINQIQIKMGTKTFSVVNSISMVLTLTAAALSIIGIAITGLYPGIIVLLLVALIPIASKFNAKKIMNKSNRFHRNYYTTLTIVNLLSILVVLWMTFVIMHDRVLHDCC